VSFPPPISNNNKTLKQIRTDAFILQFNNSDPAVHALQFLDVINMKDPTQKAHFYRSTLKDALPFIPRVSTCCLWLSLRENEIENCIHVSDVQMGSILLLTVTLPSGHPCLIQTVKHVNLCKCYYSCVFAQQKLWWQHVWPFLQQEMKAAEVLAAVLQPALAIVQEATANEYEEFVLPTFR
jgi:hypothetical protein